MSLIYCDQTATETMNGMTIVTLTSGGTDHRFVLPFNSTCRLLQGLGKSVNELCDSTRTASVVAFPKLKKRKRG